jgi:hypothetical protein
MRTVPAIDLARPTSVRSIAIPSSLGHLARLYLLVERGLTGELDLGAVNKKSTKSLSAGRDGCSGASIFCNQRSAASG